MKTLQEGVRYAKRCYSDTALSEEEKLARLLPMADGFEYLQWCMSKEAQADLHPNNIWHKKEVKNPAKRRQLLETTAEKETFIFLVAGKRYLLPTGAAAREGGKAEKMNRKHDVADFRRIGPFVELSRLTPADLSDWYTNHFFANKERGEKLPIRRYEILQINEPHLEIHERFDSGTCTLDAPVPPRPRIVVGGSENRVTFLELGFQRTEHMIFAHIEKGEQTDEPETPTSIIPSPTNANSLQLVKSGSSKVPRDCTKPKSSTGAESVDLLSSEDGASVPVFFYNDIVEVHSLSSAPQYNGKRGFVETTKHPTCNGTKMVVRFPLCDNKKVIISAANCKLVEPVGRLADYESAGPSAGCSENERGAAGGNKVVYQTSEEYAKEAESLLWRLRSGCGGENVAYLRDAVKRTIFLLEHKINLSAAPAAATCSNVQHSKTSSGAASGTGSGEVSLDNAVRGKVRRQLSVALKFAQTEIDKAEAEVERRSKDDEDCGDERRSAADAATDTRNAEPTAFQGDADRQAQSQAKEERVIALVNCYRYSAESHFKLLRQLDQFSKETAETFTEKGRTAFSNPSLGSLASHKALESSLTAIARHQIPPLKRVHIPGTSCDAWCDEPELTRRVLFHVAWLYLSVATLGELCEEPLFQAVGLSFFAQAVPDLVASRQNLCLPALLAGCQKLDAAAAGGWLYMFWDAGTKPIVTLLTDPNVGRTKYFEWLSPMVYCGSGCDGLDQPRAEKKKQHVRKEKSSAGPASERRAKSLATRIPRAFWHSRRPFVPAVVDIY
eukprot:g12541.t1